MAETTPILLLSYLFGGFLVIDNVSEEYLALMKQMLMFPTLFINDLQILFVQKVAAVLQNVKLSPAIKS